MTTVKAWEIGSVLLSPLPLWERVRERGKVNAPPWTVLRWEDYLRWIPASAGMTKERDRNGERGRPE